MSSKAKPKFSIAGIDAKANEGHEFEIIDPETGEGTGMFLSVVGKDSATYKREFRRRVNEIRRAEAVSAGKPVKVRSIEDDIADSIDVLTACTTGWRDVVIDEAEGGLPFSAENVRRLYSFDFVRLQADAEVTKVGGFIAS